MGIIRSFETMFKTLLLLLNIETHYALYADHRY